MLDSLEVMPPLARVTDANGDPVSGATLSFYLAGTTTPMTVYADASLSTALGATVTCDSAGYPTSDGSTKTLIYVGTSDYKLIIKDGDGVTLATHDNIRGALDTSLFSTSGGGALEIPVDAGSGNYTVVSGDAGKFFNRQPELHNAPAQQLPAESHGRNNRERLAQLAPPRCRQVVGQPPDHD